MKIILKWSLFFLWLYVCGGSASREQNAVLSLSMTSFKEVMEAFLIQTHEGERLDMNRPQVEVGRNAEVQIDCNGID